MSFLQRSWNVGNLLVVLGVLALALSFWWPYLVARRVARVESWAEQTVSVLIETAGPEHPRFVDPAAAAPLLTALDDRPIAERLRALSPEETAELPAGLYLEGKHFYYLITTTVDELSTEPNGPLEVYAWPLSGLSPSRTAFFADSTGVRAYSYNLRARYSGLERVPRAGIARQPEELDDDGGGYRGPDQEQWILQTPAPPEGPANGPTQKNS